MEVVCMRLGLGGQSNGGVGSREGTDISRTSCLIAYFAFKLCVVPCGKCNHLQRPDRMGGFKSIKPLLADIYCHDEGFGNQFLIIFSPP